MTSLWLLCAFFLSLSIAVLSIPLLIRLAFRWGILDSPDHSLKRHQRPTPYLGGVAIAIATAPGIIGLGETFLSISWVAAGLFALVAVGLLDDMLRLAPHQKFLGQCLSVGLLLHAGLGLHYPLFFFPLGLSLPFSILWSLSLINAFNLVDVMDGLAATLAISSTILFLFVALMFKMTGVAFFLSCFLGAVCGFLWFNAPPARIYLGDAGSLLLGGVLSMTLFIFPWHVFSPSCVLVPGIILCIPLLELVTLVGIRVYKGIPFYRGSPDHFCLYLQQKGWSKKAILSLAASFTMSVGLIGIICLIYSLSVWLVASMAILFFAGWYYLLFKDFLISM